MAEKNKTSVSSDQEADAHCSRVEIGWIVHTLKDSQLHEAVTAAADDVERVLKECFPTFDWQIAIVSMGGLPNGGSSDPVVLLDAAEGERDARGWDFVFVVTDDLLKGTERPQPRAVLSALLSTAVVSTAALREETDEDMVTSLTGMALHLFARLNNLAPGEGGPILRSPESAMKWLSGPSGRPPAFEATETEELRASLEEIADLRVEEMAGERSGLAAFYLRSIARNRRILPRQVLRMHPWSFPLRLNRLTTAAGSALLVMMLTAETWEVAANLSVGTVAILALAAILITSVYLLRAQRLLARGAAMREQRAVRNVGTALAVMLGMTITFFAAFVLVLAIGFFLFGDPLLSRWTDAPLLELRITIAVFAAALSLVIGALGASFERYGYFRHVTHVDAEL